MEPEVEVLSNKKPAIMSREPVQTLRTMFAQFNCYFTHSAVPCLCRLVYCTRLHIVVSLYILLFIAKVWLIISRGKIWKFEVSIKMHEIWSRDITYSCTLFCVRVAAFILSLQEESSFKIICSYKSLKYTSQQTVKD